MPRQSLNINKECISTQAPHENLDFLWGPYSSINDVNDTNSAFANIPSSPVNFRVKGLKFAVNNAVDGKIHEYMFIDNAGNYEETALLKSDLNDIPIDVSNLDSFNEEHNSESLQNIVEKTDELLKSSVNVNVNSSTKTFAIKTSNNTTVGTIVVGEGAGGSATLTLNSSSNTGQPIVVTLPNLKYDSSRQVLQYVNALGQSVDTVRLSNLQIKKVLASAPLVDQEPPATADFTLGDLILVGPDANNNNSYELNVCTKADSDGQTGTEYVWAPLGKITDVSLVAEQVTLNSTKLSSTDVKGGLEELYDKIDGVGASYWTGSIGISSDTTYSSVSGLTEYNKQSEPIDVYVTTAGYLWIVSSVKIIAETSGIEIPMLAPVKSGDLYYYRSEEIVKESISVMVKALAKQEGTDPNDSVTIVGSIGSDSSYTVGDTATTLSVNANSNNGGYLGYQWEKNGFAITDANSSTYTPSTSSASDSGTYRCKVTNLLDNGYEYTNIVVIEVKESQGGDTTSDWLEDTGVVHGEIATLQGYSLSPAYQIDNGDVIYAWVGENNSDQTKKIISGWVGDTWKCGWNEIKYNGRLVNTSEEAGVNNIRVMIRTSIIDKCFIYNCTKSTWLYKGASLGNVYNGFEWCKWVKTGSAYGSGGVLTIQDAKQNDATLTQTHMSPLIPLQPNHILSFKTGLTNSNGGYAKMIFYDSNENPLVVKPVGYAYSRYIAIGPTDPRVLTDTDAERITSIMAYGRLFISAMSMHECYLKDETTGEYLWKGINVID